MVGIISLQAKRVFDGGENSTIEVEVGKNYHNREGEGERDVHIAKATLPYDALTGMKHRTASQFSNLLDKCVGVVNSVISPGLIGMDPTQQLAIDDKMKSMKGIPKGTVSFNAVLCVSLAVCKAGALFCGCPLYKHIAGLASVDLPVLIPIPSFNMIIQEKSFASVLYLLLLILHVHVNFQLHLVLQTNPTDLSNPNSVPPNFKDPKHCLQLLTDAINSKGYKGKVGIAMDVGGHRLATSKTSDTS